MKKILILTVAFFSLLSSCDDSSEGIKFELGFKRFWAQNLINESFYQVNAELLARGSRCNVWVEIGSGVSKTTAQSIASTYDNNIYNKMMATFGENNVVYEGLRFSNTMAFADAIADNDGKLCILVLDIKDGYKKGVNDSYVAGYFWAANLLGYVPGYPITSYSNKCDMIYIDSNPSEPGTKESNTTLAHEMQHLMNIISTILHRDNAMDIWIDEGLASAAEYVYSGEISQERVSWFNNNGGYNNKNEKMNGSIDKGNNFFVWNNRVHNKNCTSSCNDPEHNTYAVLDDYATVSLFFQWLRLQSGGTPIYKDIITSSQSNHAAVVNALNAKTSNAYSNWETLLETWLAANFINNSSNQYGYKGESGLSVNVTYAPKNITSVQLYPGEGVYSLTETSEPSTPSGTNIAYKYITNSSVGSFSAGSTLLTYNKSSTVNYDEKGNVTTTPDSGTVTGKAPAVSVNAVPANGGRSVGTGNRPIRIDAGDLLRRKGNGESFFINSFKSQKTDAVDE